MQLTFTKSKFDVPPGQYLAKFRGIEDMKEPQDGKPRLGNDGKPMEPGMAWSFEIVDGECTGKQCDRITSKLPTPKNSCGRFLQAVSGQILKDGDTIDIGQFVGRLYRINVEETDRGGSRVSDIGLTRAYDAEGQRQGQPAGAAAASTAGPAPRRPAAPAVKRFWVEVQGQSDPVLLTAEEIQAAVSAGTVKYDGLEVNPEGTNGWVSVVEVIPGSDKWIPY